MKDKTTGEIVATIIGYIIGLFLSAFILFWLGYFAGWIAEITVGTALTRGLNILFNVHYFTPDKLPIMSGALTWIGSFFHGHKIELD